jgi:hypothetical protein
MSGLDAAGWSALIAIGMAIVVIVIAVRLGGE